MVHQDHVRLLKKEATKPTGVWADLGSGDGAFTLALRDIGSPNLEIYSIDWSEERLDQQRENFQTQFPDSQVAYLCRDFTKPLIFPPLDGVLMANSLHFCQDQIEVLKKLRAYLKENGKLIIVEYNVDEANQWVPYPVSFNLFKTLCQKGGFSVPEFLDSEPSSFLKEIYSALAFKI